MGFTDFCIIILFVTLLRCIVVFPFPQQSNSSNSSIRIIGGIEVIKNELPYQVSLRLQNDNNKHFCGGTIISENYIITAAHCFRESGPYIVIAGEHSLSSDDGTEQIREVDTIIIHPEYDEPTKRNNDIAIIKLLSPLIFNDVVASIPLAEPDVVSTGDALASGWGQTSEDDTTSSDILRKVIVPIISERRCQSSYPDEIITTSMLCAGFTEGGKDSCSGDSGGPLVVSTGSDRYLAGIISWGYGCGRQRQPGVYTKISYFYHWIMEEINT